MLLNHLFELQNIVLGGDLLDTAHTLVDAGIDIAVLIQHIGDTAAHTGSKVFADLTDNHHAAAGHVFTSVIAYTLDNSHGTGVSDTETLTGHTVDVGFTVGRTVQCHVTDNDVLILFVFNACRRIHDQLTAGQSLTKVIVGVALQLDGHTLRNKGSEALSAGAHAFHLICVIL